MSDPTEGIKKAMMNYHRRELKDLGPKRKNKKPEAEMVKLIQTMCLKLGLDVSVIEAKAVWNRHANKYVSGQVEVGYSDISGNDKHGQAIYIEVKAKDRRSTLKEHQRIFLERKIKNNCFAVCVDDPDKLEAAYNSWLFLRSQNKKNNAQKFLMELLLNRKSKAK